jgi:uncharacterized membrane-anchored protein
MTNDKFGSLGLPFKRHASKAVSVNQMKTNLFRKGVLVLNAVAPIEQLAEVEVRMPEIMSMVNFTAGNRYADYQEGNDTVAEYGLAVLILGGVAAKAGLLKGLLAVLAASWKVIAIGVIAIGGFFTRFFRRIKKSRAVVQDASIQDKATPDT